MNTSTISRFAAQFLVASLLTLSAHASAPADASQDALQRQLDEERLAYQLYTTLGESHPQLRQFQNIPRSEARHFEALRSYAAEHYPETAWGGLNDDFLLPETAKLYAALLQEGQANPKAALGVGVQVEELDIRDLDAALTLTDDPTLKRIYTNLRAGSERHLAAFSGKRGGGKKP